MAYVGNRLLKGFHVLA